MSLQPCLPLTRRRKRQDDDNDGESNPVPAEMSGQVQIADLAGMDAMEYLRLVHGEAEGMDDVFVADTDAAVADADAADADDADAADAAGGGGAAAAAAAASGSIGGEPDDGVKDGIEQQERKKNAIDGSAFAASYLLSSRVALPPPPTIYHLPLGPLGGLSPSIEDGAAAAAAARRWVENTLDDFSRLRLYLENCVEGGIGSKPKQNGGDGEDSFRRVPVPPMKDAAGWHVFTLGRDEARGNVGGYYDDFDSDSDSNAGNDAAEEKIAKDDAEAQQQRKQQEQAPWRNTIPPAGHPPTTSLLCQFDQVMVRRVLSHHVHYLTEDGYELTSNRCRWIYALLARLAKPLHRDDASTCRELLRECCVRRAALDMGGEGDGNEQQRQCSRTKLALLNVLIAVVGVYFEQGGGMDRLFAVPALPTGAEA